MKIEYGSDAVSALLRALGIEYVALNPGASYRGLHDSIVNLLGNHNPRMLVVQHEEHAVAIAHGYAKVIERPMGAIVHSNVGLMHASMAIFNAWCDRVPVVILGATGPVDAAKRRPWIDWIHTAQDQGALIRPFIKWDDQPASVAAAIEAILRAYAIAATPPCGPVYVNLDAELQEKKLVAPIEIPLPSRYARPPAIVPDRSSVEQAVAVLRGAQSPVILVGRTSRSQQMWDLRVRLAERLGARVLTDLKQAAAFPTDHPLHPVPPAFFVSEAAKAVLQSADVVLSLDWVDLAGTLKGAFRAQVTAKVIEASLDRNVHNGWSKDHQGLAPVDIALACEPDAALLALDAALADLVPRRQASTKRAASNGTPILEGPLGLGPFAATCNAILAPAFPTFIRLPLGWPGDALHCTGPLDYLGYDGGGGIGSGPGMAVGAALALRGTERLPVAILGDGDYLMGTTALWTAVANKIPLLVVIANNRAYFNDVLHQERVAKHRGRPVENKFVGQSIDDPPVDLSMMARAQGALGIGTVADVAALSVALATAIDHVRRGGVAVVDALVTPEYDGATTSALTRAVAGG